MRYLSKQDALSAAQALLVIEPGLVASLAQAGLKESELDALDSLNDQMELMAKSGRASEWSMLDRYFHIKLANNLESSEVRLIACSLLNRLSRKSHENRSEAELMLSVSEHRTIVHYIRIQDETSAFELLKLHRMRQIAKGYY